MGTQKKDDVVKERWTYAKFSQVFFLDVLWHANISVESEQLWVWEYEAEDGKHDLFMDVNEEIRFRVIDEEFIDLTPEGPAPPPVDGEAPMSLEPKKAPYTISVSYINFLTLKIYCTKFKVTKMKIF